MLFFLEKYFSKVCDRYRELVGWGGEIEVLESLFLIVIMYFCVWVKFNKIENFGNRCKMNTSMCCSYVYGICFIMFIEGNGIMYFRKIMMRYGKWEIGI